MYRFFHATFEKIIIGNQSTNILALSSCLGIFLACAPFLGIQTILAFFLSWIFRLNTTIVLIMLCTINNPLTMIPIILIDYFIGYFVTNKLFHIQFSNFEHSWLSSLNTFISEHCSRYITYESFSLWNYLIGGVIFATICSLTSYPLLYALFRRMKLHHTEVSPQENIKR